MLQLNIDFFKVLNFRGLHHGLRSTGYESTLFMLMFKDITSFPANK